MGGVDLNLGPKGKLLNVDNLHTTDDVDDLIGRPGVDAVIVATTTDTHKEIALKVIAAGKHLLLEKPAATTYEDALEILEAARKN